LPVVRPNLLSSDALIRTLSAFVVDRGLSVSLGDTTDLAVIYYITDGSALSPGVETTTAYKASFDATATTTVERRFLRYQSKEY
jgi:hypothetical protein